ncbi:MAG TPA: hypothetical protein VFX12_03110 [Vicinamibacterales bacterium]|nr:hypothetical protein [Vicinamibacterales bacterium]
MPDDRQSDSDRSPSREDRSPEADPQPRPEERGYEAEPDTPADQLSSGRERLFE